RRRPVACECSAAHRYLHSFPTRRSSDLGLDLARRGGRHQLVERHDDVGSQQPLDLHRSLGREQMLRSVEMRFERDAFLAALGQRSEEHTSELQSRENLVCRLLLEKKKIK